MSKLTNLQRHMYNGLLDLSWDEPYIQIGDLYMHLNHGDDMEYYGHRYERNVFAETLRALESANKLLCGPEEVNGTLLHTVTPIVKGGHAYSHPSDFYTTKANFLSIHQIPEVWKNA